MDKRVLVTYIVISLWVIMFCLGVHFKQDFLGLTAYFASLTGYIAIYTWSETKKPSKKNTLFIRGKNSKRELIIYISILLWLIGGFFGMYNGLDIMGIAAYFGSLTGFVASFILGEHYSKPKEEKSAEEIQQLNS